MRLGRPRLKNEMTPGQVARLRAQYRTRQSFYEALADRGYRCSSPGSFKVIFSMPHGRYVIKMPYGSNNAHTNGNQIRKRWEKNKQRLLCPLAWGRDFHVQLWVEECHCLDGVDGVSDSGGHNHTHIRGRAIAFDY